MAYQIIQGDNRDILKTFPDNYFDSIVTDPPYGIDFLGKAWDANTGALETYQECLRVLKPGGHILAFSAARTYHHLAITLEQAGFEIRDQIMWIYSSGFPKSQDVGKSIDRAAGQKDPNYGTNKASVVTTAEGRSESTYVRCKVCNKGLNGNTANDCDKDPCGLKYAYQTAEAKAWAGWGTALKPAHEPICLARKPLHKSNSIARNCQQWGVGALNIDATRIPATDLKEGTMGKAPPNLNDIGTPSTIETSDQPWIPSDLGRFPSNVVGEIAEPYQKYFYSPKVSRRERHIGHETPPAMFGDVQGAYDENGERYAVGLDARTGNVGNNHPTVKPVELMKYLIRLVTPAGGTVLDPFNGSGSTGMAAVELNYDYTGCELDPAYVGIARKRIAAWYRATHPLESTGLWE
jgi:DNA modification methylase